MNWKRQPSSTHTADQNLPPKHTSSLECAVAPVQVYNPFRMSSCRILRNSQKTRKFMSCICNTYARQPRKPFRFNSCKKHGGWGQGPVENLRIRRGAPFASRRGSVGHGAGNAESRGAARDLSPTDSQPPASSEFRGGGFNQLSTVNCGLSTPDCYSFSTGRSTAIAKCASRLAPSSSCSHRTAQ